MKWIKARQVKQPGEYLYANVGSLLWGAVTLHPSREKEGEFVELTARGDVPILAWPDTVRFFGPIVLPKK